MRWVHRFKKVLWLALLPISGVQDFWGAVINLINFLAIGGLGTLVILFPPWVQGYLPETIGGRIAVLLGIFLLLMTIAAVRLQGQLDELRDTRPLKFQLDPVGTQFRVSPYSGNPGCEYIEASLKLNFRNAGPPPAVVEDIRLALQERLKFRRQRKTDLAEIHHSAWLLPKMEEEYDLSKGITIPEQTRSSNDYYFHIWLILPSSVRSKLGPRYFLRVTLVGMGQEEQFTDIDVEWTRASGQNLAFQIRK